MSDFCRDSESKRAAKDHRCVYCAELIPKGEVYAEQTGVWDGAAFRNRFHAECYQELCDEGEGEFTPYSHERPAREAPTPAARPA